MSTFVVRRAIIVDFLKNVSVKQYHCFRLSSDGKKESVIPPPTLTEKQTKNQKKKKKKKKKPKKQNKIKQNKTKNSL